MGAFLFALSFVMPRIRRNPVIGIRVAWTLASDENWARTHRFASYTFAAAGVVALVGAPARRGARPGPWPWSRCSSGP